MKTLKAQMWPMVKAVKTKKLSIFRFQLLAVFLFLTTLSLYRCTTASAAWNPTHPDPIMEYHYSYDQAGNITKIEDSVQNSTGAFTYDEADRLTQAIGNYGTGGAQQTQTYSYNAVGDMQGVVQPLIDANGNATAYNNKSIEYNYDNRPIRITDSATNIVTEFAYDHSGQRIKKKVYNSATPADTQTTFYVGNIYEESYVVDTSSPILASTTTVTYVYAGSIRVAGLIRQTTAGGTENNTYYYHGDHLGSSSIITDGTGDIIRNISYQPWGNIHSNTQEPGASTDYNPPQKFTGQILDDSTELYYYGARYYDPQLRRFITPDIIVENPYDPQSLNRYAYCRNNPIVYVDPLGLWRISISFHAGIGFDFYYDSDTGHMRGGVGVGMGGGVSVGDNNWDVGFSNDKYIDVGYDNKMRDAYITASYGSGWQGPNGTSTGWGASGTYYLGRDEYQVGGGIGSYGVGINAGYSSFGNGSWSAGGSILQLGATYDFGSKKWNYSYTLDPKALQEDYREGVKNRKYNGYGSEGYEDVFKVLDWLGTVMAGYEASDAHDKGYREKGASKTATDFGLMTNMASGAISNIFQTNGIFRATFGLVLSPVYYGAVSIGGLPAYNAGQRNALVK